VSEQQAWRSHTQVESRWTVSAIVVVMIVLQLLLPERFSPLGRWTLPAIEAAVLIAVLAANRAGGGHGKALRLLSLTFIVIASIANGLAVILLIDGLVRTHAQIEAGTLLGTGANIWITNVIIFGIWFWELDRGGPSSRARGADPHPDFLFPQMANPEMARPGWEPQFFDYLYVSFTNATAFSPTDAMPMTRGAKAGMMLQEAISLVTAILVIARAVNILH
jgi:hypothetical protein